MTLSTNLSTKLLRLVTLAALAFPALAGAPGVEAQEGVRPDRAREQMERRFREAFERQLRERLELSDQEVQRLRDIQRSTSLDRRELQAEEQLLSTRIQRLIMESGGDAEEGDQARARELLDRLVSLRQRELEIFREEQARLGELLTPLQVLRLNMLRNELNQRIQRARQRGREGAGRAPR